jgi:hypothetical protein
MLNFNWWVNRKDPQGKNVFAGGFLGLDNIGVFDRSAPPPTGGYFDQADGTAGMAARSFKKTRTGETTFCSTSIFTGEMAPALGRVTKPDGQAS